MVDLETRTRNFALRVLAFVDGVPRSAKMNPLISQLVRSGTSVGANYCEADNSISQRETMRFLSIAQREAAESKYWLHLIGETVPKLTDSARDLWREAHELNLILASIVRRNRKNQPVQ